MSLDGYAFGRMRVLMRVADRLDESIRETRNDHRVNEILLDAMSKLAPIFAEVGGQMEYRAGAKEGGE